MVQLASCDCSSEDGADDPPVREQGEPGTEDQERAERDGASPCDEADGGTAQRGDAQCDCAEPPVDRAHGCSEHRCGLDVAEPHRRR
jgi:hypothetical protein